MLDAKTGLVFGVANDRSIAWAISEACYQEGAELAFAHLPGDRSGRRVRQIVDPKGAKVVVPCDVQKDEDLDAVFEQVKATYGRLDFLVHSIAFAPTEELRNPYADCSRSGWLTAMDISAYSLVAVTRRAADLMTDGGTVLTLTYVGGETVVPGYNLMGVCKAALEHSARYLAWDLGRKGIRVNSISAGPVRTLASAGISDFEKMRQHQAEKTCLGRNIDQGEIAQTALYLLSGLSTGVTGETIHVDSGYSIVGL